MNKETIHITLPFVPRTKKNNSRVVMRGKYPRVLPSKTYEELEKACCKYLALYWQRQPIEKNINLECHFFKDKDYRADLVGYLQAIQDILVKANVIKDDNHKIVVSTDGSRVHLDRQNPRIEIYIREVENVLE